MAGDTESEEGEEEMKLVKRIYQCGEQHHFIGKCEFHLATFVDDILVSTVGAYPRDDEFEMIGVDRYYETMVFRTDDDWSIKANGTVVQYSHPDVLNFSDEIGTDDNWTYNTADDAVLGHQQHVEYWLSQDPRYISP